MPIFTRYMTLSRGNFWDFIRHLGISWLGVTVLKFFFYYYGYSKQNSKILHSYHRKRMSNSFSGTFFNRHRIQYESGALNAEFSKKFVFLPPITDRIENVNRYMGSVNLSSIDITEDNFEVEGGIPFNPSKLDYENPGKEKMRQAVLKVLKKVVDLSNTNIIKNAERLLSKRSVEQNVEWVGETGKRAPENRYKLLY